MQRETAVINAASAALLLAAAAWFAFHIGRLPIWYDETIAVMQLAGRGLHRWADGIVPAGTHAEAYAGIVWWRHIYQVLYLTDVHPPLYYYLALAWARVFGGGLESLRVASMLAILASGLLVGQCAAMRGGPAARLAGMAVYFAAPLAVWAAVNARGYGLAFLLESAALLAATLALDGTGDRRRARRSGWPIVAAGMLCGLAFLTHYFTLLMTAPMFALLAALRVRQRPGAVCLGALAFAGCMALVLPLLLHQFGERDAQYAGYAGAWAEATALARVVLEMVAEQPAALWPGRLHLGFFAVLLAAALSHAIWTGRRDPARLLPAVTLVSFVAGVAVFFLASGKSMAGTAGLSRYASFLVPALAILLGRFIVALAGGSRPAGVAAAVIVLLFAVETWHDGTVRMQPWSNRPVVEPAVAAVAEVGPAAALAVIPIGFGQGTPAIWGYVLPPDTPMLVVRTAADLELAAARLASLRVVLVARDESGRLAPDIEAFKARLQDDGFRPQTDVVYRR